MYNINFNEIFIQITAGAGRAQVIVLIIFGRVNSADRQFLNDAVYRIRRYYPSTYLLVLTRWAPRDEFADLVRFPDFDIFLLDQYNEEMRAERDGIKVAERIAQVSHIAPYLGIHFGHFQ